MEPTSFIVPNRGSFVDATAALIDQNTNYDQNITIRSDPDLLNNIPAKIRSIPRDAFQAVSNGYSLSMMHDIMQILPVDTQSVTLEKLEKTSFQSWITTKMYCHDDAVELYANRALEKLNVVHLPNQATETFLRHKFTQLVKNSDKSAVDKLLVEYHKEENPLEKTASKYKATAAKVGSVARFALIVVAVPVGIYTAYHSWAVAHQVLDYAKANILPVIVNKIVKNTPLVIIHLGNTLYDWKLTILFATFTTQLLVTFTRLNNYSFIRIPVEYSFKAVVFVVDIPGKISRLPFEIAQFVFFKVFYVAKTGADIVGEKSGIYAQIERNFQLKDAENLFVHQVMQLKVQRSL
jgi:hypothetical protein